MNLQEKVLEFHTKFGHCINAINEDEHKLRTRLIDEECYELNGEFYKDPENGDDFEQVKLDDLTVENRAAILKEMCDVVYVILGYCVAAGWNFNEAFKRVHESNMSKLGADGKPLYRDDGKVIKGPNYKAADLKDLVK